MLEGAGAFAKERNPTGCRALWQCGFAPVLGEIGKTRKRVFAVLYVLHDPVGYGYDRLFASKQ